MSSAPIPGRLAGLQPALRPALWSRPLKTRWSQRIGLLVGLAGVSVLVAAALLSWFWTPYDPYLVVPADRLLAPGPAHWLGTDRMGIDLVARLMVGARTTLIVGVVAVLGATLIGVPLGIVIGMRRGFGAEVMLRVNDILFALPALLLAILLVAVKGASITTAASAIGIAAVPVFVRMAHAATLSVMTLDFIDAARTCGTSSAAIALRHVLPNIAPTIGVQVSASFATAILAEAGLSYLGLAAPAATPTWGRMMRDGQVDLFLTAWPALVPGLAIALAVLSFNLLGDGLRDLLDPRLRELR